MPKEEKMQLFSYHGDNQPVEIAITKATGEIYLTPAGYARLSSKPVEEIRNRCEYLATTTENTKALMVTFLDEPISGCSHAILIAEYKLDEWLRKDSPETYLEVKNNYGTIKALFHWMTDFKPLP